MRRPVIRNELFDLFDLFALLAFCEPFQFEASLVMECGDLQATITNVHVYVQTHALVQRKGFLSATGMNHNASACVPDSASSVR